MKSQREMIESSKRLMLMNSHHEQQQQGVQLSREFMHLEKIETLSNHDHSFNWTKMNEDASKAQERLLQQKQENLELRE